MASLLSGIALLGASVALFYPFIPRHAGQQPRAEWIDISVAIGFSAGIAIGIGLIVAGAASFYL
jgi:hypothetical protein